MRMLLTIIIALVFFSAAVAVPMWLTGKFTKENIQKITNPKPPETKAAEGDDVGPLAQALKAREEELKKREAKVQQDEERLQKMQTDLDQIRSEIQSVQTKITASLKTADAEREKRLQDVALSMTKMKPEKAAEAFKEWPPDEAAEVFRLMKDKERGKILDAMDTKQAAAILAILRQSKI
jgi:flagellar motility protein MotE (MotC chaperone)